MAYCCAVDLHDFHDTSVNSLPIPLQVRVCRSGFSDPEHGHSCSLCHPNRLVWRHPPVDQHTRHAGTNLDLAGFWFCRSCSLGYGTSVSSERVGLLIDARYLLFMSAHMLKVKSAPNPFVTHCDSSGAFVVILSVFTMAMEEAVFNILRDTFGTIGWC